MDENKKSFSIKVKEELSNEIELNYSKSIAILSSFIKLNGIYKIQNKKEHLILKINNQKVTSYIHLLIRKIFNIEPEFLLLNESKLNKKKYYVIDINKNINEIFEKLLINPLDDYINNYFFSSNDLIYGYIKGAFLASGSINSPINSNYHLEIKTISSNFAISLQSMLNKLKEIQFNFRLTKRRNEYILYIKKSDLISSFLIMIGAVDSCLEYENIRIERDFSNIENRLFNLDSANYSKMIKSSSDQINDIKIIDKNIGIKNLNNEKLVLLCNERLQNPEVSLLELSKILSHKLNFSVSRSNIYHLFKKIKNIADKYR